MSNEKQEAFTTDQQLSQTTAILNEISPIPKAEKRTCKNMKKGTSGINTPEIEIIKNRERANKAAEGRKRARLSKRGLVKLQADSEVEYESDDDEDASCFCCNSLFSHSKKGELWIRCQKCLK